jgi:hypothetical protein
MTAQLTMTPDAFSRIEQAFGVALPEWYRLRVLDYPFSKPEDGLHHDEESIVRANEELRRDGWFGFPWPQEFFVIGDTGFGDSYFIVTSTGDRRIFIADHEGGPAPSIDKLSEMAQADTLDEHVRAIQENLADAAQQAVGRRPSKKWWQYWI